MTLAQLNARMAIGVARPDLTADNGSDYSQFLNDAQREICRLHSWRFMLTEDTVTIPANQISVTLPSNFKELSSARSPVHLDVDGVLVPVDVWTDEKLRRLVRSQISTQIAVCVDWTATPPKLSVVEAQLSEPLDFVVKYFGYLDDLATGSTESNVLTNEHPEMLLAKAKSLAFATVNDSLAADMEALFMAKFRPAKTADLLSQIKGTQIRM